LTWQSLRLWETHVPYEVWHRLIWRDQYPYAVVSISDCRLLFYVCVLENVSHHFCEDTVCYRCLENLLDWITVGEKSMCHSFKSLLLQNCHFVYVIWALSSLDRFVQFMFFFTATVHWEILVSNSNVFFFPASWLRKQLK